MRRLATIKGIEVMRALLRKGQASAFYYSCDPTGEMRWRK